MDKTIIFQNFPHIGEQIFSALELPALLNCRLVCKSWNDVLNSPSFWLKKLREVGQPLTIEMAWINLIRRSIEHGVQRHIFAKCLRLKYQDFIEQGYRDQMGPENLDVSKIYQPKYLMEFPPLHTACFYGHFDIVKSISHLIEDCNRPMYFYKDKLSNEYPAYEMPINVAIRNGHTEIAKFLADRPRELQGLSIDRILQSAIYLAILNKNLELVKYLVPRTQDLNQLTGNIWIGDEITYWSLRNDSLVHAAVRWDFEILSYLITLPEINPNILNKKGVTALHQLCDKQYTSEHRIENIIEKVKILAPLANPNSIGPLHLAAREGSVEIIKILIKFLDANALMDYYFQEECQFLPIDFAILSNSAETVAILAPHTKELRLHKVFRNKGSWFVKKSMDMMKSLIEERNRLFQNQENGVEYILGI